MPSLGVRSPCLEGFSKLIKKSFRCAKIRDLCLFHKNYNHFVYQYDNTCFYSLGHKYFFLRYPYFVCLWYWLLSTKIKVYQNKRYWNKKQSFIHSHWYVFDNWSAYITLWKEFAKIVWKNRNSNVFIIYHSRAYFDRSYQQNSHSFDEKNKNAIIVKTTFLFFDKSVEKFALVECIEVVSIAPKQFSHFFIITRSWLQTALEY